MPIPPRRPNVGKPWTPEETETLRRLTADGVPTAAIAEQLGRSRGAVSDRARRIGLHPGGDHAAERQEPRPPGPETRADKPAVGWTAGDAAPSRLYVRVHRGGQPPMPW